MSDHPRPPNTGRSSASNGGTDEGGRKDFQPKILTPTHVNAGTHLIKNQDEGQQSGGIIGQVGMPGGTRSNNPQPNIVTDLSAPVSPSIMSATPKTLTPTIPAAENTPIKSQTQHIATAPVIGRLSFEDLTAITLLKFYDLAWSERSSGRIESRDLPRLKPGPVSDGLFLKAVNELVRRGEVTALKARTGLFYGISIQGIKILEDMLLKPDSPPRRYELDGEGLFTSRYENIPLSHTKDSWLHPDYKGSLDSESAYNVRNLLESVLKQVDSITVSGQERAQLQARLQAGLSLAQAPVPPWGKLIEIVGPIATIPSLNQQIRMILREIG